MNLSPQENATSNKLNELCPDGLPAVPVKRSFSFGSKIISLIDGSRHADLMPHLNSLGVTADEYREYFGLPQNYPMSWDEAINSNFSF